MTRLDTLARSWVEVCQLTELAGQFSHLKEQALGTVGALTQPFTDLSSIPPLPVPVCADARLAPERFARLWRLSLGLAFVGPARSRRRAALSYRVRVWAFSAIRG